jgi:hypothetical protein
LISRLWSNYDVDEEVLLFVLVESKIFKDLFLRVSSD